MNRAGDIGSDELSRLEDVLAATSPIVVAVSGGIDSLTLMAVAHRLDPTSARAAHAVSPAVPVEATARVRQFASRKGWVLDEVDAEEFSDSNYADNPVNRCFYCKNRLYSVLENLSRRFESTIVSGTNLDDMSDFRPGLEAARMHNVRHPFVEARIGKAGIRRIARKVGLEEISDIPASPCLASRVETGIKISPVALRLIDSVESNLRRVLDEPTVRCRLRKNVCEIELGETGLARLDTRLRQTIADDLLSRLSLAGLSQAEVKFAPYRKGSGFIRPEAGVPV